MPPKPPKAPLASIKQQIVLILYILTIFGLIINSTITFITPPEQYKTLETPKVNTLIGGIFVGIVAFGLFRGVLKFRGIEQGFLFLAGLAIYFSLNIANYFELDANMDPNTKALVGKFTFAIQLLGFFIAFVPSGLNRQLLNIWLKFDNVVKSNMPGQQIAGFGRP